MHWAEKIAHDLIRRHPEREVFTCASGISPSGPIHVGNLRDILTIWFVGKVLEEQGKTVRFFHSWDDYDRLRKLPQNVPESYSNFIGKPLAHIPDPWGGYESYALRHEREFEESLRALGIVIELRSQATMYQSGAYRNGILEAVRARKTIYDILAKYRTQDASEQEREGYYPITIYCEGCNKDTTVILRSDDSEALISYACSSCGYQGTIDLSRASNVKLPWKIDWAMRWRHENVIFEPGGKDHATSGGSFDVSSEISTKVFHFKPPLFQPYEFIGLKELTGKMSGSSGQLLTPHEVLQIYQPEVLLWIFARIPPTRAFDLVVDDQISRIYEEFDRAYSSVSPNPTDKMALHLACVPGRKVHPVSFRQLASFSGIVQGNCAALERIFSRIGTPYPRESFEERLQKAENWLEHYAPDQRTVLRSGRNTEYFRTLPAREQGWVHELYGWLKASTFGVNEATEKVYAISKEPGLTGKEQVSNQRRFFQLVYNLLFGKDKGPRLGTFLAAVPLDRYIELLNFTDVPGDSLPKSKT
ncbi:MAG: lysine--tRNA ligase [Candidatus Binatia bacterium]